MTPSKVLAACALALFALMPLAPPFGSAARAQFLRPPTDVPDAIFEPAQGADAAGAQLRIDRLENQMRGMTGQIEQMQFQIRRLEEQLRKFQQDVDFRFDELKTAKPAARPAPATPAPAAPAAPARRTELNENGYPVVAQGAAPVAPPPAVQASGSGRFAGRRGDAFDPALDPAAPGAPRDLTTMAPGANAAPPPAGARISVLPAGPLEAADEAEPNAPLDLTRKPAAPAASLRVAGVDPAATASLQGQAGPAPRVIAAPAGAPGAPSSAQAAPQVAALPPAPSTDDYDVATAALKDGQLDVAEQRFRSYLDQHPKDRLTPEATFFLGETYLRRARPREAAEQYLKITMDFPAPRARPKPS